jgi:arylsulfatase A-like enzyme
MIKYKYLHIVTLILLCINPLYTPADVIDELIVETSKQQAVATAPNKIILFVWDGLRDDVISQQNTPVLYKLKNSGTYFSDHHSSFPTVTMNNASSIATGNYSGQSGFYGNRVWRPDLKLNLKHDSTELINTEKNGSLDKLDDVADGKPLLYVETLLQVARKHGLKTAQIGKEGPVLLQDANKQSGNSIILTENKIYPADFLLTLQKKGYVLPSKFSNNKLTNKLTAKFSTAILKESDITQVATLDGRIPLLGLSDPSMAKNADEGKLNEYIMAIYIREILADQKPDISIVWLSDPDSTQHSYGPGTVPFYQALKNQDQLLGSLLYSLEKLNLTKTTNIIVVSDHGHSSISADTNIFPLRELSKGKIGEISKNTSNAYSVSGTVRVADLLTKAGFKAYDGKGCSYNPVQEGMGKDRTLVNSIKMDKTGKICNDGVGRLYTTGSYRIPKTLEPGSIIVAGNGGAVFLYVPDKDEIVIKQLVRFLQSHLEFDSIFIDPSYGNVPGTLSMAKINFVDNIQSRNPDILVSMSYDKDQAINGVMGTAYSTSNVRGAHGSLSPADVHNVLIASGPDFKVNYVDSLPTANVDVPVTLAKLLNIPFENRSGREILEALTSSGVKAGYYDLNHKKLQPNKPAVELNMVNLGNLGNLGKSNINIDKDSYTFVLNTKELSYNGKKYIYIDSSKAERY